MRDAILRARTSDLLKMTAFRDIKPCSLVEVDRCFRGAYCDHLDDRDKTHVSNVGIL
jgi:hypothetical protein